MGLSFEKVVRDLVIVFAVIVLAIAVFVLVACGTTETREERLWRQGVEKLDRLEVMGCDPTPLFLDLQKEKRWPGLQRVNEEIDVALRQCQ